MKTQPRDSEYYYARACRFFDEGNYSAAKNEYEHSRKAGAAPNKIEEINSRIKRCEAGIREQKRAALLRLAGEHLEKDNTRRALECYLEANEITPEPRLEEKIKLLKEQTFRTTWFIRRSGRFGRKKSMRRFTNSLNPIRRSLVPGSWYFMPNCFLS